MDPRPDQGHPAVFAARLRLIAGLYPSNGTIVMPTKGAGSREDQTRHVAAGTIPQQAERLRAEIAAKVAGGIDRGNAGRSAKIWLLVDAGMPAPIAIDAGAIAEAMKKICHMRSE